MTVTVPDPSLVSLTHRIQRPVCKRIVNAPEKTSGANFVFAAACRVSIRAMYLFDAPAPGVPEQCDAFFDI